MRDDRPAPVSISVGSEPVAWTTRGNLETLASTPKEARYMWGLPSGSTISVPLYSSPQAPAELSVGWEAEEKLTVNEAWTILCETPDITSPEEYPDHALITMEQLGSFMARAAPQTLTAEFAHRLFDLHGFMLLETYRGKHAVTVTFPDLEEAQQFHGALVELSTHRPRPRSLMEGSDNG